MVVPLSRLDCEGLRHVGDSEPVAQNDRISEWAESNPLSNTLAIEPDLMASAGSGVAQSCWLSIYVLNGGCTAFILLMAAAGQLSSRVYLAAPCADCCSRARVKAISPCLAGSRRWAAWALTARCLPAAALDQRPSLARARSPGTPEAPTQSNDRVRPLSPLLVRDANWLASPEGSSGGGPLVAAREGPTILIR